MPAAFEPPPTQATTASGSAEASRHLGPGLRPMTDWKSRTIIGYGWGPSTEPMM
jgi:hypothetical protein